MKTLFWNHLQIQCFFIHLDSTADLERHEAMMELEQLKKRVAELEEKLGGKKRGGLKFKVPCPTT
jgi:hypothetical protein